VVIDGNVSVDCRDLPVEIESGGGRRQIWGRVPEPESPVVAGSVKSCRVAIRCRMDGSKGLGTQSSSSVVLLYLYQSHCPICVPNPPSRASRPDHWPCGTTIVVRSSVSQLMSQMITSPGSQLGLILTDAPCSMMTPASFRTSNSTLSSLNRASIEKLDCRRSRCKTRSSNFVSK